MFPVRIHTDTIINDIINVQSAAVFFISYLHEPNMSTYEKVVGGALSLLTAIALFVVALGLNPNLVMSVVSPVVVGSILVVAALSLDMLLFNPS